MTLPVAILCGGKATRLGPLTATMPKSLIEVAGEPFIYHQLRLLHKQGFNDVVLCVGNFGGMIYETVGNGSELGMHIDYSWDGPKPLGTGGALKKALPKLGNPFMAMYGDSYLPSMYQPIVDAFLGGNKLGLTTRYKNVDYGIGILTHGVFDLFEDGAAFDLGDVYEFLWGMGALLICDVDQRFYEIGSPEGLEEVRQKLGIATKYNV